MIIGQLSSTHWMVPEEGLLESPDIANRYAREAMGREIKSRRLALWVLCEREAGRPINATTFYHENYCYPKMDNPDFVFGWHGLLIWSSVISPERCKELNRDVL